MKPLFIAVTALAGLTICSASGLKEAALKTGRATTLAIKHRDMKAFHAAVHPVVTSDFVYTEEGRKMNYDEMTKEMKTAFGMLKTVSVAEEHILQVKEMGMKGETRSSHHIKGTIAGPDGKSHTLDMVGTSKETWVKKGGMWHLASMSWLGQKQTLDGKMMPMMAPSPSAHAAAR